MDEKKCPKCGNSSTADFWDRQTKAEAGVTPDDHYVSISEDKDKHDELQTFYHCPICNEEVDGSDLARQ